MRSRCWRPSQIQMGFIKSVLQCWGNPTGLDQCHAFSSSSGLGERGWCFLGGAHTAAANRVRGFSVPHRISFCGGTQTLGGRRHLAPDPRFCGVLVADPGRSREIRLFRSRVMNSDRNPGHGPADPDDRDRVAGLRNRCRLHNKSPSSFIYLREIYFIYLLWLGKWRP